MVDQDRFGARLRSLMQEDEPSEEEQVRAQELSDRIANNYLKSETFHSQGWVHIVQDLQDGIDAAERLILEGTYEDEPKKSAELRGQIRSYKALLGLPARTQQEIEMDERELRELRP